MSSTANLGCSASSSADVRDEKSCSVASPSERITMKALGVLDQGHATCSGEVDVFWKIAPGILLGPVRAGMLDYRAPSDHVYRIAYYEVGFVRATNS